MKTRQLGKSGIHLTMIGLGTWAIGGNGWDYGWGYQDDLKSIETIHQALDLGINWIDTAHVYGFGHSESIVGKALKQHNDIIVATKCGLIKGENGHAVSNLNKKSIIQEAEGSLKRLQRDVIDIYQIHWPNPAGQIEEAFEALQILKQQGKIRYASVSNFSTKQIERVLKIGDVSSLQPPYSILNRRVEDTVLEFCKKKEIGVIVYSPMQCGLLTDKCSQKWIDNLPEDDWRKKKSLYFQKHSLSVTLDLIDALKKLAGKYNITLSQLAIAWVLDKKTVTSAIVGARTREQIIETVKSCDVMLSAEILMAIDACFKDYKNKVQHIS